MCFLSVFLFFFAFRGRVSLFVECVASIFSWHHLDQSLSRMQAHTSTAFCILDSWTRKLRITGIHPFYPDFSFGTSRTSIVDSLHKKTSSSSACGLDPKSYSIHDNWPLSIDNRSSESNNATSGRKRGCSFCVFFMQLRASFNHNTLQDSVLLLSDNSRQIIFHFVLVHLSSFAAFLI